MVELVLSMISCDGILFRNLIINHQENGVRSGEIKESNAAGYGHNPAVRKFESLGRWG